MFIRILNHTQNNRNQKTEKVENRNFTILRSCFKFYNDSNLNVPFKFLSYDNKVK